MAADRVREADRVPAIGQCLVARRQELQVRSYRLARCGPRGQQLERGGVGGLPSLCAGMVRCRRPGQAGIAHPLNAETQRVPKQPEVVAGVDDHASSRRGDRDFRRLPDKAGGARRPDHVPRRRRHVALGASARGPGHYPGAVPVGRCGDLCRGTRAVGSRHEIGGSRRSGLLADVRGHYDLIAGAGTQAVEEEFLLPVDDLGGPGGLGGPSERGHGDGPGPRQAVLFRQEVVAPFDEH